MSEIICNKGILRSFEGMTFTTQKLMLVLKSWLSLPTVDNKSFSKKWLIEQGIIYITSQDRGTPPHVNGQATDISFWVNGQPSPLISILAKELISWGFTAYVSTYNYHVHLEPVTGELKAETLYIKGYKMPPSLVTDDVIKKHNGKIVLENINSELFNILALYKAFPSNMETDLILAYFGRKKNDYDAFYRKIFLDGSRYAWDIENMDIKESSEYMQTLKPISEGDNKYIKYLAIAGIFLIIYKKI